MSSLGLRWLVAACVLWAGAADAHPRAPSHVAGEVSLFALIVGSNVSVDRDLGSGDVLIADADLAAPAPGDVLVTPATGAYGYAMANNYNGVPRPPVIFCSGGEARVVVRRETYDDLTSRDLGDE